MTETFQTKLTKGSYTLQKLNALARLINVGQKYYLNPREQAAMHWTRYVYSPPKKGFVLHLAGRIPLIRNTAAMQTSTVPKSQIGSISNLSQKL